MAVYKEYCDEIFDDNGNLERITLHYPDNFNFAYDVVDKIAKETPDKRAIVWCNVEGEERIFSFSDISKYSNRVANVFRSAGICRGDRVMLILKRHYEYWFAALALHKLGAVMIPATHMLTVSDFVYRIRASKVKGIVCTNQDEVPEKVVSALEKVGTAASLFARATVRRRQPFSWLTSRAETPLPARWEFLRRFIASDF